MQLDEIIEMQRQFDQDHESRFQWAAPLSADDSQPLTHGVLALAGEVGELANIVKKYERGDFGYDELMELLPGEVADVFIYLVKIAYQSGIDLEDAFRQKLLENKARFKHSEKGSVA